ncbi:MAG: hypothetical protein V3T30_01770 [Thermodesulfobacteriota bacterium]
MKNGANDNKIALDVAEAEFKRFTDAMDLDVNTEGMSADEKRDFTVQRDRLIKAIQSGALTINDNGEPVYTPQRANAEVNAITFNEPTGASYLAMDRKKVGEDMGKLFSTMADITGTSSGIFSKMKNSDLKVCMAIVTLFLA